MTAEPGDARQDTPSPSTDPPSLMGSPAPLRCPTPETWWCPVHNRDWDLCVDDGSVEE